jgi:hypothetical protein
MTLNMLIAGDQAMLSQGLLTGTPNAIGLAPAVSPLMLCDRLLTLAKDADRVGLRDVAEHLLGLANEVLRPAAHSRPGRAQRDA